MCNEWAKRLSVALLALVLAGCGGQDAEADRATTASSQTRTTIGQVSGASAPISKREYKRQKRQLRDTPRRVIGPVSPDQRLSFASAEAGARALIDAIRQGELTLADRIVASLPLDQRKQALQQVVEQDRQLRRSDDYAVRLRFRQFLHYNPTQLWKLDAKLLSGRVVDATNYQPVANVEVREDLSSVTARTGDSGHFRIRVPANRMLQLTFTHPAYQWYATNQTSNGQRLTVEALKGAPLEVALTPNPTAGKPETAGNRVFSAYFHDAETGEPLRGIGVTVSGKGVDFAAVLGGNTRATTDDTGHIEGRGLPEGPVDLLITGQMRDANGHFRAYYHSVKAVEFKSGVPVHIKVPAMKSRIERSLFVMGEVRDAISGKPVSGATVAAGANLTATTDENGRFRIKLPAGKRQWQIVATHPAYHQGTTQSFSASGPGKHEMGFTLAPITTGSLSGVVVDRASGQPIADAQVELGGKTTRSDAQGRFAFDDIEAGEVNLTARREGWHSGSTQVLLEAMKKAQARLELAPVTTGSVTGRVTDAATGQPLAGANIAIGDMRVRTGSDGRFRLDGVEAGDIQVSAQLARYQPAVAKLSLSAMDTASAELALDPITWGMLHGTVRDAQSGQPLQGVVVSIGAQHANSDETGTWRIEKAPVGTLMINAHKPVYRDANRELVLEAGGEASVDLRLQPITTGRVVGRVLNNSDGTPIAGARIHVSAQQTQSDADGRFALDEVEGGQWRIEVSADRYLPGSVAVSVEAAAEAKTEIRLDPVTWGTVGGTVRDAQTDQPLPGVVVSAGGQRATSDETGAWRLEKVPAGTLMIHAHKPVYRNANRELVLQAGSETNADLRLQPITTGWITGIVLDADTNVALSGARVSAGRRSAQTGPDGRFVLDEVLAGEVSIHADHATHLQRSVTLTLEPGQTVSAQLALDPITWGTVSGQVADAENGQPLAGAEVTIGGHNQKSDGKGLFHFEKIKAGDFQVRASAPAYQAASVNVSVKAAEGRDVEIRLSPIRTGDIVGRVVDEKTGAAISGARVMAGEHGAETDASGTFRLMGVTTGSQTVFARHPDYADGSITIEVEPNVRVDAVLALDLRREDVTSLERALAREGTIDLYGIYFDSGRDQFKASSLPTLQAVLQVMQRAPGQRFIITGHTDADGSDQYNQDLSERRARRVIDWLAEHGIARERLTAVGLGENEPVAPNDSESGKALNRRVQLSIPAH